MCKECEEENIKVPFNQISEYQSVNHELQCVFFQIAKMFLF